MDEGGRHNDAGTEVLGNEECPSRHAEIAEAVGQDGKDGSYGRADEDDENGRDPKTHVPVIFIASFARRRGFFFLSGLKKRMAVLRIGIHKAGCSSLFRFFVPIQCTRLAPSREQ